MFYWDYSSWDSGSTLLAVTVIALLCYRSAKATIISLKLCNGVFFIQEEPVSCSTGDFLNNMPLLRRNLFVSLTILTLLRELERTFSILHFKDDPSKTGRGTSIIENQLSRILVNYRK